jgi:hypothetical protein
MNSSAREVTISQICLENITSEDTRMSYGCGQSLDWFSDDFINVMFTIFGVVSLISLTIVFIVYWVIPEFNSLHGKIVLSNVVSIAFLTSFILIVYNVKFYEESVKICKIIGYFGYFSSMCMFSWMTIMCFDLCHALLGEQIQHFLPHNIRFVFYSVIGWGSGLGLSLVLFILENILPPSSDLNAEIGNQMCFISTNGNKFLYLFHLPILIMMMLNISFFTTIIIFITKSNHTANFARSSRR